MVKEESRRYGMRYNILLSIISLCICFFVIEGVLIITNLDQEIHIYDYYLGAKHPPGASVIINDPEFTGPHRYTFNSDGFLDDEFSQSKEEDEIRIFLMGDSFMEAIQVDISNATHRLLEEGLIESGRKASVYNFANSGFGTVQYYLMLKKYGQMYKPDIVIFTFIENDLRDINPDIKNDPCLPYLEIDNGKLSENRNDCEPPLTKMLRTSKFAKFMNREINRIILSRRPGGTVDTMPVDFYTYQEGGEDIEHSYVLIRRILAESKLFSESIGAEFMIVTFPNYWQTLTEERWEDTKEKYNMTGQEWDIHRPFRMIEEICDSAGISCLHSSGKIREEEAKGTVLYFHKDGHFNEDGHKLLSENLQDYLIRSIIK